MCQAHAASVIDELHERATARHIGRCIWPKCREYEYAKELKLCKTHAAIVMYQGDKHMFVKFQYYDLQGLDAELAYQQELTDQASARDERRSAPVTLYVIQGGMNVKIGYTARPLAARLRDYPPNHTLLVHFPGTRADETALKRKFRHLRTHGNEWLAHAPEVTEWIDRMIAEHGKPDADLTCGPAKYQVPRPHQDKQHPKPKGWVA